MDEPQKFCSWQVFKSTHWLQFGEILWQILFEFKLVFVAEQVRLSYQLTNCVDLFSNDVDQ